MTAAAIPPLSQSMYEAMACPASYQAIYVHGAESPSNEYSELGQENHGALKQYVTHLRDNGVAEDWALFESIVRAASEQAQEILRGFIGSMKFDPRTILDIEKRIIYDDGAGTPDLVTMESPTAATIWDYKSYFEIIEADTFQSKLYPLLLFRHNPSLQSVRFVLVFLRYGRTTEVTWTRDQVPALERVLAAARERQKAIHETDGLARAIPGKACTYCPLLRTARCQVNDWNPYATMTPSDRLQHVIFLTAALNESKAIIRSAAQFLPVTTTDANGRTYEASFKLAEKRLLPLNETIEVLEDFEHATGENLKPKTYVSRTSLASLRKAKKRVLLDQGLHDIEIVKPTTKFKISKVDPEAQDEEHDVDG